MFKFWREKEHFRIVYSKENWLFHIFGSLTPTKMYEIKENQEIYFSYKNGLFVQN